MRGFFGGHYTDSGRKDVTVGIATKIPRQRKGEATSHSPGVGGGYEEVGKDKDNRCGECERDKERDGDPDGDGGTRAT